MICCGGNFEIGVGSVACSAVFEYYGEAGSPKKVKPNGFIFCENWPFGPVSFAKAALSHETWNFFLLFFFKESKDPKVKILLAL